MTIQTIVIKKTAEPAQPIVRLAGSLPLAIWGCIGSALAHDDLPVGIETCDINLASQRAASELARKVASRGVKVELLINPLIPPLAITEAQLVPLILTIAENASASVEPGPGTVILQTWWRDKFVGVDAIGRGGCLPEEIRENLMRPGFSTRVADWDTGFGLHAAIAAARCIEAQIELFEAGGDVGFRLAVPIEAGTPKSPAAAELGIEDDLVNEHRAKLTDWIPFSFGESREVVFDVSIEQPAEA